MTATVTDLRAWKPDHLGDDPTAAAVRSRRAALASQVPRSRWAGHLTPVIPLPTGDDDQPDGAA